MQKVNPNSNNQRKKRAAELHNSNRVKNSENQAKKSAERELRLNKRAESKSKATYSFNESELIFVSNWDELRNIPDSDHFKLDIEEYNGWIKCKETGDVIQYLSTHTFYGTTYKMYQKTLNEHGFPVKLANWDAEESKTN